MNKLPKGKEIVLIRPCTGAGIVILNKHENKYKITSLLVDD